MAYALFSTTQNTNHLKKYKFLYTPKLTLLNSYKKVGEEFGKMLGRKSSEKKKSLVQEINDLDNELTILTLCYYVLLEKDSDIALNELKKHKINASDKEKAIKQTLASIKMIEVKIKAKIKELEKKDDNEGELPELDTFLENKISFRKDGYINDSPTVAEYAMASKMRKKEIDRINSMK